MAYVKPAKAGSQDETLRDAKGHWLKGTPSPNPNGRPRRVIEAEALAALSEVWNTDELKAVARTVLSFAKAGNITAAITILKYQAGNPPESLNVHTTAGNELADLTDEQITAMLVKAMSVEQADGELALPSGDEPDSDDSDGPAVILPADADDIPF